MKFPWVRLARALALVWAGFWMFFFIVESWSWHTPLNAALPWVGAGLLFIVLALVPWRWELPGGLLLVVVGFAAGVAYAIWSAARLAVHGRMLTTLAISVPPIVAGVLFLMRRHGGEHLGAGPIRG